MRILFVFFVFGICLSLRAGAQTTDEKAKVESAVRNYVDAFYYGDTAKVFSSISPNLIKHGYFHPKGSTSYAADTMSFQQCIAYAAKVQKRGASANVEKFPKKIEVFDVQDKTAVAKLTAWWGTDYLLLTKTDDRWLITHVLWQSPPAKAAITN